VSGCLRALLSVVVLIGGLLWVIVALWGLAFCEAYNCEMGYARLVSVSLLVTVVAVLGLAWTIAGGGATVARNSAAWSGAVLLFGLAIPALASALR
jgi:hypothetical protein